MSYYIARQIDGELVSGRTSSQVELKCAMSEIYKLGKKGKQILPEAWAEVERLQAVWDELKLDEEE